MTPPLYGFDDQFGLPPFGGVRVNSDTKTASSQQKLYRIDKINLRNKFCIPKRKRSNDFSR
jgi:hypothetical protein